MHYEYFNSVTESTANTNRIVSLLGSCVDNKRLTFNVELANRPFDVVHDGQADVGTEI